MQFGGGQQERRTKNKYLDFKAASIRTCAGQMQSGGGRQEKRTMKWGP